MTGTLVTYARFVEVQQRRARVVAELGQSRETPPLRMRRPATDERIDVDERPTRHFVGKSTHGIVDGR